MINTGLLKLNPETKLDQNFKLQVQRVHFRGGCGQEVLHRRGPGGLQEGPGCPPGLGSDGISGFVVIPTKMKSWFLFEEEKCI